MFHENFNRENSFIFRYHEKQVPYTVLNLNEFVWFADFGLQNEKGTLSGVSEVFQRSFDKMKLFEVLKKLNHSAK